MLGQRDWFPPGLTSYVNIQRQFFDGFVGQTFKDADKLVGGYILVFVYVNLMLSKMNFVEQRIGLSIVGIMRLGNRFLKKIFTYLCVQRVHGYGAGIWPLLAVRAVLLRRPHHHPLHPPRHRDRQYFRHHPDLQHP